MEQYFTVKAEELDRQNSPVQKELERQKFEFKKEQFQKNHDQKCVESMRMHEIQLKQLEIQNKKLVLEMLAFKARLQEKE